MSRLAVCVLAYILVLPVFSGAAQVSSTISPCDPIVPQPSNERMDDLSGRLGSKRGEFESVYGAPKGSSDLGSTAEYDIPGCGKVDVSFDPDSYVVSIDLFPNRQHTDGLEDFWKSDPADWASDGALTVAENFIPLDAEVGALAVEPNPFGFAVALGSSDALLDQIPESSWDYTDNSPDYGTFLITLWLNESNGVLWITLQLNSDEGDFPFNS